MFKILDEKGDEDTIFQLKFSILQIYKEVIYDLLTGEKDLKIKEHPTKGIYVEGLSEVYIDNPDTFYQLLAISQDHRVVSGTKLNHFSSRSHTIFILEVTQTNEKTNIQKKGILNLVDLAGSEKVSKTGAVGETLEEAKKINLSLSALGNVIHSLTSTSDYIPYRDSKLTRILQESLGGNYKTSLIVACSPHLSNFEESLSSLKFAQRVKIIKNIAKINVKQSYEELQKQNLRLQKELSEAKKQIEYYKSILDKKDLDGYNNQKAKSNNLLHSLSLTPNELENINAKDELDIQIVEHNDCSATKLNDENFFSNDEEIKLTFRKQEKDINDKNEEKINTTTENDNETTTKKEKDKDVSNEIGINKGIRPLEKKLTFRIIEDERNNPVISQNEGNEERERDNKERPKEGKKSIISLLDLGFVSKKGNHYDDYAKKIEKLESDLLVLQNKLNIVEIENVDLKSKIEILKTKNNHLNVKYHSL